jgi:phosphoglycolate phosphatase-like HAD superfamily hydrolase
MRRNDATITFDQIAERLGLPSRQAARLLFNQGVQYEVDDRALSDAHVGAQVDPYRPLSKRVEARIRREHPEALEGYDRLRSREVAQGVVVNAAGEWIRSRANNGSEQEPF